MKILKCLLFSSIMIAMIHLVLRLVFDAWDGPFYITWKIEGVVALLEVIIIFPLFMMLVNDE